MGHVFLFAEIFQYFKVLHFKVLKYRRGYAILNKQNRFIQNSVLIFGGK